MKETDTNPAIALMRVASNDWRDKEVIEYLRFLFGTPDEIMALPEVERSQVLHDLREVAYDYYLSN